MVEIPHGIVPAQYIGHRFLSIGDGVPYYNIDGTRKEKRSLEHGDTLLLRNEDVYGKTLWHDPKGELPSEFIGLGETVKAEHADKSREELIQMGYEFHRGRRDVVAVVPLSSMPSQNTEMTVTQCLDVPEDVPVMDSEEVEDANTTNP